MEYHFFFLRVVFLSSKIWWRRVSNLPRQYFWDKLSFFCLGAAPFFSHILTVSVWKSIKGCKTFSNRLVSNGHISPIKQTIRNFKEMNELQLFCKSIFEQKDRHIYYNRCLLTPTPLPLSSPPQLAGSNKEIYKLMAANFCRLFFPLLPHGRVCPHLLLLIFAPLPPPSAAAVTPKFCNMRTHIARPPDSSHKQIFISTFANGISFSRSYQSLRGYLTVVINLKFQLNLNRSLYYFRQIQKKRKSILLMNSNFAHYSTFN